MTPQDTKLSEPRCELDGEALPTENEFTIEHPPKRGRGRPKKSELAEAKLPRGRPRGDNYAMEQFKARLIASPRSGAVIDSILKAALDDDHKNQAAAWKLLIDRLLPLSYFEKDKLTGGKPSVSITINGIGGDTVHIGGDNTIDAEDVNYRDDDE